MPWMCLVLAVATMPSGRARGVKDVMRYLRLYDSLRLVPEADSTKIIAAELGILPRAVRARREKTLKHFDGSISYETSNTLYVADSMVNIGRVTLKCDVVAKRDGNTLVGVGHGVLGKKKVKLRHVAVWFGSRAFAFSVVP
jgi:hypothetical protein